MNSVERIPFISIRKYSIEELIKRSRELYMYMNKRRSLRHFSPESIPEEVMRNCIMAAGTAPSGANLQPWSFILVKDPGMKRKIRIEAEEIERSFYREKISEEWRCALESLGTDYKKPFLETAPYLIVIFVQKYGISKSGSKVRHYYPHESVGIATGFLITILHQLGISSLTYTPRPMNFLNRLLKRPENESPYLILVVGNAAEGATVPRITKKSFHEICTIV